MPWRRRPDTTHDQLAAAIAAEAVARELRAQTERATGANDDFVTRVSRTFGRSP